MQMMQWVEATENALGKLEEATVRLCAALKNETGFAYYWESEVETHGRQAREKICKHLQQWQYPDKTDLEKKTVAVGAIACSPETLELAEALNEQKARWDTLHRRIRREACGLGEDDSTPVKDAIATQAMRRVLSLAGGYGNINLDATDRKVPVLRSSPLEIRWYRKFTAPSSRKTIADVLDELYSLTGHQDQTIAGRAQAELARLSGMDKEMPVAYRAKAPVESLWYESMLIRHDCRETVTGYAVNPVCYLAAAFSPELSVFEKKKAAGAGRPPSISAERVSPVLPHYYWYLRKPKTKKPASKRKRTQNPHAPTAFPGLWLGVRKRRNGELGLQVVIERRDKSRTGISVDRWGRLEAWRKAGEVYSEDRGIPLSTIMDAVPSAEQVTRLLEWARENGDSKKYTRQ